jgi:uncharacterized membrane protein
VDWLFPWLLFLHVLGAIIAFGPSFSFSILGSMGGAEPQHANFGTRVALAITDKRVEPFAILQGITGLGLIWAGSINLFGTPWLLVAIAIYLVALGFALFVQRRNVKQVIALSSAPPPADAPPGPPPGLSEAVRRVQQGGIFLAIAIVVIVALMVLKPQF